MYQVGDKVVGLVVGEITKVEKDYNGVVSYDVKSTVADGKGRIYGASESELKTFGKEA
jgi:hypothetical protein